MTEAKIEFLRARLAEDEQAAQWAAEQVGDARWQQRNVRLVTVADRDREIADYMVVECIDHMVRHDPARVLREVEAKRRLIERYERATATPESASGFVRGQDDGYRQACLDAIKDAAEVYADHPDYREE